VSLGDITPYRANARYGILSFAMLFVALLIEIETVVFAALAVAGRPDLFLQLQPLIIPAAVMVSLTAALVFAWRATAWTRARMDDVGEYSAESANYAERLAQHHRSQG